MAGIGVPELLIVLAILLLIFGPKRLPSLGRQLGGGMREFKDSITGKTSAEDDEDDEISPPPPPAALPDAEGTVAQPAAEADPAAPPRP